MEVKTRVYRGPLTSEALERGALLARFRTAPSTLSARPWRQAVDADHQCLQPEVPVVCAHKNLGCDTALTIVQIAGKRYRMYGICDTPGVDVVDATFSQGTVEFQQITWGKC